MLNTYRNKLQSKFPEPLKKGVKKPEVQTTNPVTPNSKDKSKSVTPIKGKKAPEVPLTMQ